MKIASEITWFLLCVTLVLSCKESAAQVSKCPYDYFEVRNKDRDYLSFKIRYAGSVRLASSSFSNLMFFYEKYKSTSTKKYQPWEVVSSLNSGFTIESPVPFDSLRSFSFATPREVREVDSIAKKGEKHFIEYYFNKHKCQEEKRNVSNAALMKHLQAWCIVARQDDETGLMCVTYKFVWIDRMHLPPAKKF